MLLLDEPSAGLSPALQDEVFVRCRRINQDGRGDPDGRAERPPLPAGRATAATCSTRVSNAYTGTGRELLADPKVIELYLGTLAKATGGWTSQTRCTLGRGGARESRPRAPGFAEGSRQFRRLTRAGVEVLAEGVAHVAVDAVDGLDGRADALLDERSAGSGCASSKRIRTMASGSAADDLADLGVERWPPSGRR